MFVSGADSVSVARRVGGLEINLHPPIGIRHVARRVGGLERELTVFDSDVALPAA